MIRRRSRFCATLLALVLYYSTAAPDGAAPTTSEEFDGPAFRTPTWIWQNPGRSSAYAIAGGTLTLSVGSRSDQWVHVDEAPRVLQTPPRPEWSVETHVADNPGRPRTFAGLAIFKDAGNWLLWGQVGANAMEVSGIIADTVTPPVGTMANRFDYLRIRRLGNVYQFDASPNGEDWTNANTFVDTSGALEGARVGFMAKNWRSSGSYDVTFDYLRWFDNDRMPTAIKGIRSTELIAQQTGEASFNGTAQVDFCGGDLGHFFNWNGRTYVTFGDTKGCGDTPAWRSNTLAYTSDLTPGDGLLYDGWITGEDGRVKELFNEDPGSVTAIPTAGIGIGSTAYLFYMQVTDWATWRCNLSSIATADAGDEGSWTKHTGSIQWAPGNFNMVAILEQGPDLYIYGTPCGRAGSVKLMKVSRDRVLDKAAYRYLSGFSGGAPVWSATEARAITVAGGPAGELSVRYNAWLGRYVMTSLDIIKKQMVIRESPRPWGPWSGPVPIASLADYPIAYGGFMKDGYEENGGQSLYFMMSMWTPYQTYWMRTTFEP